MASAKSATGSKAGTAAAKGLKGSSTVKTKGSSVGSAKGSAARKATERTGASKKTNSGGTRRTASKQAEPTKSKQAKAASSRSKSGSTAGAKSSTRSAAGEGGDGVLSRIVRAVGGMLKGRSSDATDMLKKDHRKVEELFEKVKANEDGNNRAVFKRIKAELDVHTHIEEKIFYPFLLKKGDDELQKIVREGIEEHRQAKMFLAELNEQTGTSELFKARIKVLMEDIEHHVKEEEDEMFPMVEDQFDAKTREKLGARMQAEKAKFKERAATRSTAAKKAARTRAANA